MSGVALSEVTKCYIRHHITDASFRQIAEGLERLDAQKYALPAPTSPSCTLNTKKRNGTHCRDQPTLFSFSFTMTKNLGQGLVTITEARPTAFKFKCDECDRSSLLSPLSSLQIYLLGFQPFVLLSLAKGW
eukprot:TRINITY_DN3218_c0_g1_i1.p1 TRINITY_DN3218_c0_g1~~TRINITY_DN3218_c0_g1_i1.p1  ORF type:complete len:131 (+),score=19.45 TRINITY_DN3218_c0_g1_i1:77-469(+)